MQRDSWWNTIKVALWLCVVCSLLVSSAAVLLRERQDANRERERRKNILKLVGLYREGEHTSADIDRLFAQVQPRVVDLDSGEFTDAVDPVTFDPLQEAKTSGRVLRQEEDPAILKRRERHAVVYLVEKDGRLEEIVLPIRGYGLWSTLHGFIALDADSLKRGLEGLEIRGLTYYQHAETPGLGGEVDNPLWKAKWAGKKVYGEDEAIAIQVKKSAHGDYEVDALSGATITSRGVTNMLQFWFGPDGFKPFLEKLHRQLNEPAAVTGR